MSALASLLGFGDELRLSTRVWNAKEAAGITQCGDDVAVFSPSSSTQFGHIAQRERSATLDGDLFQLAAGGESNPLAVGREERILRSLCTRQDGGLGLIEQTRGEL